jgi:hypothetical protein
MSATNGKTRGIIIHVCLKTGEIIDFCLVASQAQNESELKLPLEFYSNGVNFPHYETKIITPHFARGETGKLNYHFDSEGKGAYVCFPSTIADEVKLQSTLTVWAVGQACVMSFDRYLNEMITVSGGNNEFLAWAETQGIKLMSYSCV